MTRANPQTRLDPHRTLAAVAALGDKPASDTPA